MTRLSLAPLVFPLVIAIACGGSRDAGNAPPPSINISPTTAKLLVNQTAQFEANVEGMSSTAVTWSVRENNGGTVTSGLYHAPWKVGTYHLAATAVDDITMTATATVTVTAFTAFLETLPGGTSAPVSVTPVLGMLQADGTWQAAPIIDPTTHAAMDTSFSEIFLSGDGTELVASQPLSVQGLTGTWNIVRFNSDGTGKTSLTNNVPGNLAEDYDPQFSQDGKSVVYSHRYSPDRGQTEIYEIWLMSADGSNPHKIESTASCVLSPCYAMVHIHPSFSADSSKIVFDYWELLDTNIRGSGIAIANTDGTRGPTELTFNYCTPGCQFADARPAFTSDGSKVVFERTVNTAPIAVTSLYVMDPDGSNLAQLYNPGTGATVADPRAMADTILFSSNVDNADSGTNGFEIYSVMLDGSNVTRVTNNSLYDGFTLSDNSPVYPTERRVSTKRGPVEP
jgi:hypothetical protein